MGVVHLAHDETLNRHVALKVLAPGLVENPTFRERFIRESRLAASIDHPHIVPVYESGESDGTLFIAMRYVEGADLRALLAQEGSLAPERALSIASQVAGALDAAHAVGLVHRDVKPANVLIDRAAGEHCYLTDFGLTKNLAASSGYTETGQFVGTLSYVAPEQIAGDAVDARADVYSLGMPPIRGALGAAALPATLGRGADVRAPQRPTALDPARSGPSCRRESTRCLHGAWRKRRRPATAHVGCWWRTYAPRLQAA